MLPKTSSSKCRWFAQHSDFREVNPKVTGHTAANHSNPLDSLFSSDLETLSAQPASPYDSLHVNSFTT